MRFLCLACDYDGTLAHHGRVDEPTVEALKRFRHAGRHLVLVTGRELGELLEIFPEIELFEWVVAENGALLYRPASRQERPLADPPNPEFVRLLAERGVDRISVGRVIVATWEPHEVVVLETIRDLGLELEVIFNKGAVMVLPTGITKASGLKVALAEMGLSPHNVVAVGDAENDHALLASVECGVAVANSIPALKQRADWVTHGDHGRGVTELIDDLIADDFQRVQRAWTRHHVLLGIGEDGEEIKIDPYGPNVLVAGSSGSGKSSLAVGLIERLVDRGYQVCVIDPEGDYSVLEGAVVLGTPHQAPSIEEAMQLLAQPGENVVVNLVSLRFADRPPFFLSLLGRIQELRSRTARPHWIFIDEAHHVIPADRELDWPALAEQLRRVALITVEPSSIAPQSLSSAGIVIAVGDAPQETLADFGRTQDEAVPTDLPESLESGEVVVWFPQGDHGPQRMRVVPGRTERRRHHRKYAEGDLGEYRSFYFRGPEGKLNLRAQNLIIFMQIADGVDDETWTYHLKRGEYSRWFRQAVKDDQLADETAQIERANISPQQSRALIKAAIERYYTLPIRGEPAAPASS